MPALLLLLTLAATPVEEARGHLAAGRLDDVLFALDGKKLAGADQQAGAAVLGEAALASWKRKDAVLALQFSQMALKWDARQTQALEAGARGARAAKQFGTAEKLCDRWLLVDTKNAEARLLRAELALDAGEWQLALNHLDAAKPQGDTATRAEAVRAKASRELGERQAALSTVAALEQQLRKAQEDAARDPSAVRSRATVATRPRRTSDVVLYSTSWCGYCKKARAWFQRKRIAFVEKDVEKDPAAAQELAGKALKAGVRPRGVPVIDVKGTLVLGFDVPAIEKAL